MPELRERNTTSELSETFNYAYRIATHAVVELDYLILGHSEYYVNTRALAAMLDNVFDPIRSTISPTFAIRVKQALEDCGIISDPSITMYGLVEKLSKITSTLNEICNNRLKLRNDNQLDLELMRKFCYKLSDRMMPNAW